MKNYLLSSLILLLTLPSIASAMIIPYENTGQIAFRDRSGWYFPSSAVSDVSGEGYVEGAVKGHMLKILFPFDYKLTSVSFDTEYVSEFSQDPAEQFSLNFTIYDGSQEFRNSGKYIPLQGGDSYYQFDGQELPGTSHNISRQSFNLNIDDSVSSSRDYWIGLETNSIAGGLHFSNIQFQGQDPIVPEPATMALFGIGLVGVLRRRRKI